MCKCTKNIFVFVNFYCCKHAKTLRFAWSVITFGRPGVQINVRKIYLFLFFNDVLLPPGGGGPRNPQKYPKSQRTNCSQKCLQTVILNGETDDFWPKRVQVLFWGVFSGPAGRSAGSQTHKTLIFAWSFIAFGMVANTQKHLYLLGPL